jgi:hypothetical protein
MMFPKQPIVRDERYRRFVASLPCIACGRANSSQCAHSNSPEHGKGKSIKASDHATFPLCAGSPSRVGCHAEFDQGVMFSKEVRREMTRKWIAATQRQARKAGLL